jgi:undecaprenyl phosphate-alpha-L-ara4FN deformylase
VARLALKIDVDTHRGLGQGVARLLDCLRRHGIPASFYVSMGPDNSGKAIRRLFTRPGFAAKMLRSNALRLYGIRTALSGTLLPALQIARSFPHVLRRIVAGGHELGVHGYDHVYWHDHLLTLDESQVEAELNRGLGTFHDLLGFDPSGFAAPGWQCSAASLAAIGRGWFRYQSSTRGRCAYRPRIGAVEGRLPEVPTTLPTLDELLGLGQSLGRILEALLALIRDDGPNILTVHAEVEGGAYLDFFASLLQRLSERVRFERMMDLVQAIERDALPVCSVVQATLPGRAGTVSCQAE